MLRSVRQGSVVMLSVLALWGCDLRGTAPEPDPGIFEKYIALGNSITAGFESGGINDSTQANSYAVILAERTGATFSAARFRPPGCPPPLMGPYILTDERVGGPAIGTLIPCAGFYPLPQEIQNLAIPGYRIGDVLTLPLDPLARFLYLGVFGTAPIVTRMVEARPTLVTVWLGNNDLLAAALTGNAAQMTPVAEFEASAARIAEAMRGIPTLREAVILGVTDPTHAPALQPGAYFWALSQSPLGQGLLGKPVGDDCDPLAYPSMDGHPPGNLLSLRVLQDDAVPIISCAEGAPYVLGLEFRSELTAKLTAFNAVLAREAAAGGWIFLDVNPVIEAEYANPDRLRKCQRLASARTPEALEAALRESCPHPQATSFFGEIISFDGVHPARPGQVRIADAIEQALVARHGAL